MNLLKNRIVNEGVALTENILKVDSFLNHQLDPNLMHEVAKEFAHRFEGKGVTKILTIEASGIAPAIMLGYIMQLPVVFIKKKKPSTMDNMLEAQVYSFTKQSVNTVSISRDFLSADDHIVFIDDFLASGNAVRGVIDICSQVGAKIEALGFVIEKGFQGGGDKLRQEGYRVESLAIVDSLENGEVIFRD